MKAIVIGGGPIACLVAIGLRKRLFDVHMYERGSDPRLLEGNKGPSFNLTLTLRGLGTLDEDLRGILYRHGIPLPQRVIHHADGTLSYQSYGIASEHHLLSIPRGVLRNVFLDEAERLGVRMRFEHECVRVDASRAGAALFSRGNVIDDSADLLIGCDGVNSVVRHEMSRQGCRMNVEQTYVGHGYVEIRMPPSGSGEHILRQKLRVEAVPQSQEHGLHIWPRGEFMLMAQPNVDFSYTTSLFMPLATENASKPCFERAKHPNQVIELFAKYFPDALDLLPNVTKDFFSSEPASLRALRAGPYHHGRCVLMGDAAHTMVPFYGQGINCSFEDVHTFLTLVDEQTLSNAAAGRTLPDMLSEFTRLRKAPCDAIVDLSYSHLRELTLDTGQKTFHDKSRFERELYRRHAELFVPLYCMVAFTRTPYHEVVAKHEKQQRLLQEIYRSINVQQEPDKAIEAYVERCNAGWDARLSAGNQLELTSERMKQLMDATSKYVLDYHRDVADRKYPASYIHDSVNVSEHLHGRLVSAELRESEVPHRGADFEHLLSELTKALGSGTLHTHPGFMAHVPSGGLFQAALGEFMARALNRFAGVWVAAPGLVQLEVNVIRWFCSILGYGEGSFGYLTTGGSIANLMGLLCARQMGSGGDSTRAAIYLSEEAHFSVRKAARLIGFHASQIRIVPTKSDLTLDLDKLATQIALDTVAGLTPVCVIATAGTTNTGAIDDLVATAALCRDHGLWLHVDACFGGFFNLTERGKAALAGIEQADSIAVDAHKSLFLPHGLAALLVKDRAALPATFHSPGSAYLPGMIADEELIDFCNYGPELSREFRGLMAWVPIKLHGIGAFTQCLDQKLDLAEYLAERLSAIDEVELISRHLMRLPVLNFKVRCGDAAMEDAVNYRLCELICFRSNVYVTTTELPGDGVVIRVCILHHQTDRKVVDALIGDLKLGILALGPHHARKPANVSRELQL